MRARKEFAVPIFFKLSNLQFECRADFFLRVEQVNMGIIYFFNHGIMVPTPKPFGIADNDKFAVFVRFLYIGNSAVIFFVNLKSI